MLQRGFGRDEFERKWSRPRRGGGPPPCREPRCADSRRWSTVASAFLFLLLIGSEPQLLVRPKSIQKWLRRWADIAWVPSSLPRVHWLHSWVGPYRFIPGTASFPPEEFTSRPCPHVLGPTAWSNINTRGSFRQETVLTPNFDYFDSCKSLAWKLWHWLLDFSKL